MTSIYGTSSTSVNRSIHGLSNETSNAATYSRDLYKFQILYTNVLGNVTSFFNKFNNINKTTSIPLILSQLNPNEINILNQNTNSDLYTTIEITNLIGYEYSPYTFEQYRIAMNGIINAMNTVILLMIDNNNRTNTIKELNNTITTNSNSTAINQLNQIISNQFADINPLSVMANLEITVQIEPWYAQYFLLWGAPANGVFDSLKLANIVNDLIVDGVITLYQYLNSPIL